MKTKAKTSIKIKLETTDTLNEIQAFRSLISKIEKVLNGNSAQLLLSEEETKLVESFKSI